MQRLWAPWRMRYVVGPKRPAEECVFCAAAAYGVGPEWYVLARGRGCYSILNAYPYNNGHLMVVPMQHTDRLTALAPEVQAELLQTAALWTAVLGDALRAEGFNLGFNLGAAAGAGIAEHLHLHLVPRWTGDSNFMPVVGGTKVLPQDLSETYLRLRGAWLERFGEAEVG